MNFLESDCKCLTPDECHEFRKLGKCELRACTRLFALKLKKLMNP